MIIIRNTTFRRILMTFAVCGILGGAYQWYMTEQGNFHPITPGRAYRSAQLDRDELEGYIQRYGIRTVINLRGHRPGRSWYDEEIRTCQDLQVSHYDVNLSAVETPSPETISRLLRIMSIAHRPVLIHCQAGADRSGLAAALWKSAIDGTSDDIARSQLTLLYGHIPVGPTRAMDTFLDSWLQEQSS